ncbi:hypothetical protein Bra1253DRAFT_01638 [Bradyrhizobium sp. WSM1253]|jgi:hypothetical protein|nr:hypothetical protein Bra1253DRAFT_01638 [Bradyrhizobium sp. WSM1253]
MFWSKLMPEYRAYILGSDGHIQLRLELDCADEPTASERAKQLVNRQDVELWEGARKIATYRPEE